VRAGNKSIKMKVMNAILLVLLITCNQKAQDIDLRGKWVSVRVELKDGDTGVRFTLDGKPYPVGDTLTFVNSKNVIDSGSGEFSTYLVSGKTLKIGYKKFFIEKLTLTELVLLEDEANYEDSFEPLSFRTYYTKLNE
jgi:hypothetical protein